MIIQENALLLVIDIQGKLSTLMYDEAQLIQNSKTLIKSFNLLNIPVLTTEQYPEKLGTTRAEIKELLIDNTIFPKFSFSIYKDENIKNAIDSKNKKQIVVIGMEAHICVYQSCIDLISNAYEVYLVADAVSSRSKDNKGYAIERLQREGVKITTTEMILFELLTDCKHEKFRDISKMIR